MRYALLLTPLALVGCGGGSDTHVVKVEGVTVTVVQPPGHHTWVGKTQGGDTHDKDESTGLEFAIRAKTLTVNGKTYGAVAAGDEVRVEAGKVTVNGTKRRPEP